MPDQWWSREDRLNAECAVGEFLDTLAVRDESFWLPAVRRQGAEMVLAAVSPAPSGGVDSALVRIGDELQSEASRLAEAVDVKSLGYEAREAHRAVRSCVDQWTEARAVSSPTGAVGPVTACPTCASPVEAVRGGEGTAYYKPVSPRPSGVDPDRLREALDRLGRMLDSIERRKPRMWQVDTAQRALRAAREALAGQPRCETCDDTRRVEPTAHDGGLLCVHYGRPAHVWEPGEACPPDRAAPERIPCPDCRVEEEPGLCICEPSSGVAKGGCPVHGRARVDAAPTGQEGHTVKDDLTHYMERCSELKARVLELEVTLAREVATTLALEARAREAAERYGVLQRFVTQLSNSHGENETPYEAAVRSNARETLALADSLDGSTDKETR